MPKLCRFYGIIIRMYVDDHPPPHFHAEYAGQQAVINIHTMGIVAGELPSRALGLVMEWAYLHREELKAAWNRAENLQPVGKIDPLQ